MHVVAVHGLGCASSQGWPRVQQALGAMHELVAPALHGADGTTTAPKHEWGIRAQAARIARQIRPDTVLVGHSMGGTIAIRAAAIVQPRMLVLVEPHVLPRAGFVVKPALEIGAKPAPEQRAWFLRKMAAIPTGEGAYSHWIARWDWRVFHHVAMELANGDGANDAWMDGLPNLNCPVRLLWGGSSEGEDPHRLALAGMGIKPTMVANSGHFVPSEAPAALAKALLVLGVKSQSAN